MKKHFLIQIVLMYYVIIINVLYIKKSCIKLIKIFQILKIWNSDYVSDKKLFDNVLYELFC